jgi:hypothetical protein
VGERRCRSPRAPEALRPCKVVEVQVRQSTANSDRNEIEENFAIIFMSKGVQNELYEISREMN